MGRYQDILPSQYGWIHELARAEIHPDAEKLLQLGKSFDPQRLVEESTIDFLTEIREHFTQFSKIFNGYSETGSRFQETKIYSVAQTPADFMVFRNQVKLLVANSTHGVISISFNRHVTGAVAVGGQVTADEKSQEIQAQVGPFRDVFWTFQGEKVVAEQVAKFYFGEFVRVTRNVQRSKTGSQLLVEEIKTLLKEKGIDF